MTIQEAVLKVATRCNIDCTYCYEFNLADTSWRTAPKFMSIQVLERTMERIRDHCLSHGQDRFSLVLHGGEPLLIGAAGLDEIGRIRDRAFGGTNIDLRIGVQSNGLLLDDAIAAMLRRHRMSLGISIDGPPEINDRQRVDHQGKGTGAALEPILQRLTEQHKDIFAGFLVVIDIDVDPLTIFDYLRKFQPAGIDVIFPHDNHERKPKGKFPTLATPYATWLIRLFDHWWSSEQKIRIRLFESIVRLLLGGRATVDGIGPNGAGIVVVYADGTLHGNDALKGTFDGATRLDLNVFEHDFDQVLAHPLWETYTGGLKTLCPTCRDCDYVKICGGGYLTSRWSKALGFANPSIYCLDLQRLIDHIAAIVYQALAAAASSPAIEPRHWAGPSGYREQI